jgi:hypothetical protein
VIGGPVPTFRAVLWSFFALLALGGCDGDVQREVKNADRYLALREWNRNEAVLERAISGFSDEDELIKSVIFFKELTGISVRGDGTTLGFLLDEKAKEDLVRLQQWCKQHCDEIYWDEASQKVKRLPAQG